MRQLSHMCRRSFTSEGDSGTERASTLNPGRQVLLLVISLWRMYHLACIEITPEEVPWMALIAPSVALFCKECLCEEATTTGSSSSSNSSMQICPDFCSRNPSSHIMRATHLALSTLPFLSRIFVVHSPLIYTLGDWLSSSGQQQQQQLLGAFRSKDFEWYLWNTLAEAVAHLHTARNGRLGALGCKALKAPTASQWGPLGDLGDVVDDDVLVPHLDRVLGCLRTIYLVLASDSCLAQLRCLHQQQQQEAT